MAVIHLVDVSPVDQSAPLTRVAWKLDAEHLKVIRVLITCWIEMSGWSTWAISCLSIGLREMIRLVLLVRPTNRWREVGDRDTDTALLSRLHGDNDIMRSGLH